MYIVNLSQQTNKCKDVGICLLFHPLNLNFHYMWLNNELCVTII